MRKRLIGKAFAVAMTGAMAFTATPVTASIFNVAHVVKAAEADQAEEWTYCYVGLTWAEYWAHEDVYNAGNASSSDVLDSKKESDKGGYDVITRATAKHGLHRGSYQCMATIFTTDADGKTGPEYKVSHWSDDGKTIYLTDGSSVSWNKGKITDNGNTYTMSHYEVSGIKYVPVAVKTSQLNDLKDKYQVVENGGTLTGGYTEVNLSAYTATANVTANTNGLKTATENSDGSFSFSARKTGSESGLKDTAIKKVDSDKITVTVQPGAGSYGEFLRVDLNGDAYGDLGSNMQAVTWTYYGYDDTYSKPLATYGTKFAADNWMHKSMGIQLGLTDSIRCQLPKNTDGTGYWSLTVYALGYEDYTVNFEATKDNIVSKKALASDEEKASLQKLVTEAESLKKDSYVDSSNKQTAFANLQTELDESKELLNKKELSSAEVSEQISHLTEAINAVKALKTKDAAPSTTKPAATTTVTNTTTVKAPAKTTVKLSKAKKTSIKVSWKKISGVAAYQIQYSTSKNFKNAKTVKVSAKSTSKVLKKLKKNKKYYVRVRSYKVTKVNNKSKNVYSAWSAKKALKTKKK